MQRKRDRNRRGLKKIRSVYSEKVKEEGTQGGRIKTERRKTKREI